MRPSLSIFRPGTLESRSTMPRTFSRQVGASGFPQRCSFTIILELNDRMILNPLHDLVDRRKGHQKPLARLHRISKTVFDRQVKTRWREKAMQEIIEL